MGDKTKAHRGPMLMYSFAGSTPRCDRHCMASEHIVVIGIHSLEDRLPLEILSSLVGGRAHSITECRVEDEATGGFYKRIRVIGAAEKTGAFVLDKIPTTDRICADRRQARGHRFEGHIAEGLGITRKEKDVGRCVCSCQVLPLKKSGKFGVWKLPFQLFPSGSVPDDHTSMRDAHFFQAPNGVRVYVNTLFPDQSTHERNNHLVF